MRSILALAILLVATSACGAQFSAAEHTVRLGRLGFRVGELPAGWRRVALDRERVAFHHEKGGTISAGARCERYDDVSLEILTDHGKVERNKLVTALVRYTIKSDGLTP